MKIEIEIKPGTARRIAVVGVTLLIVGGAVSVYANQIQFSSGQTLTAADLNNNFNELYAKTAKPIATFGANQTSVNGVYCGATANTTGNIGGLRPAKLLCETSCGSLTAHMCTSEEVVRDVQLGYVATPVLGWIATGELAVDSQGRDVNDCHGFSQGTDAFFGTAFFHDSGYSVFSRCGQQLPVLCCD